MENKHCFDEAEEISPAFYEMANDEHGKTHNEIMNDHFNDVLPYIIEYV